MENYFNQMYFVVFILLGAFFILNLFIGVIIDNFNRLKQQYEDGVGIILTQPQRNWINTLKAASLKKPSRRLTRPTVSDSTHVLIQGAWKKSTSFNSILSNNHTKIDLKGVIFPDTLYGLSLYLELSRDL